MASGERAAKSGGCPGAKWLRRVRNRRRVLTWFAGWWRNHELKRAKKPHLKFSCRNALNGPATRPKLHLPWRMASGIRQPPRGWRLMPARERECDELPYPICPCSTERSGGDLMFLLKISGSREINDLS